MMKDNERIQRRRIRRDAVLLVHEALRLVVAADHDSPETIMEMTSTCKDLAEHADMAINYYDAAILQAKMGVILNNAYWLLDNCNTTDERLHAKIIKNAVGEMDDYMRANLRPVAADEVEEVTDDEIDDDGVYYDPAIDDDVANEPEDDE